MTQRDYSSSSSPPPNEQPPDPTELAVRRAWDEAIARGATEIDAARAALEAARLASAAAATS